MALKRAALAAWRYGCHRKGSLWRDGGKCFAFGRLHLFLTSIAQMTGRSTPATPVLCRWWLPVERLEDGLLSLLGTPPPCPHSARPPHTIPLSHGHQPGAAVLTPSSPLSS
jgi:hypothetical protein